MSEANTRGGLLALQDDALLLCCRQETYRASGPGGQHRNKTDSAVRLSVMDGVIVASCANHRSQHRNRSEALRRLRLTLAMEIRVHLPPERDAERWDGSWKLGLKDRRYAGFLAHVLDVLDHNEWAIGHAAEGLGVSTGKLVRRLSQDPSAWHAVNQARAKIGLVHLRRP